MKRTNFITKLVSAMLFVAMLAYIGVYLINSASNNIRTAPAVYVELTDSVTVTGIVVRDETLISSEEAYISVVAESGQILAAGETIALAYSGEAALERAGRIRELELQKQYIEAALYEDNSDTAILKRDSSIKNAVTELGAASARHELDRLASASVTLASLVMDNPDILTTAVDLNIVNDEINRLELASAGDTKAISAPSSGLFFAQTDGFEYLTPEDIKGISAEDLTELYSKPQDTQGTVIGKLGSPMEWYYAAEIPFDYYERFPNGQTVSLDFGRYCPEPVQARVVSREIASEGGFAVVFRCTTSVAEMLYARKAAADILFETTEGIRVPIDAVYEEEAEVENEVTGATELVTRYYVYTVTGLQAEKKYIDIIWESGDYYLAEMKPENPSGLREGNDIILTKKDIYDGMLIGGR